MVARNALRCWATKMLISVIWTNFRLLFCCAIAMAVVGVFVAFAVFVLYTDMNVLFCAKMNQRMISNAFSQTHVSEFNHILISHTHTHNAAHRATHSTTNNLILRTVVP